MSAMILILSSCIALGSSCNTRVYDQIYRAIIRQTEKSKLTRHDFVIRNNTIEMLRKLCKGQKSSYETH